MVAQKKPGRPRSPQWVETDIAIQSLGITARQLRSIRAQLKPGYHYRVKNPTAAKPRYLWHVARIEPVLSPEVIQHG